MQLREKPYHIGYALFFLSALVLLSRLAEDRLPSNYQSNPGQGHAEMSPVTLEIAEPYVPRLRFVSHTVAEGDTISGIAARFGVTQDTIISVNRIERARTLRIGTLLFIPSLSGLLHDVKEGDTLESIANQYQVDVETLRDINETRYDIIHIGQRLFIPDARLPTVELRRVWGELFRYPLRGWISSPFGYRSDPFTGRRRFHNGIDIGGVIGAPVRAAMEGRVLETGYNEVAGNYILIQHVGGFTTFYAHLLSIRVNPGAFVREGQIIGEVGNTGLSTGPHLHFSIFRWGRAVNPVLLLH